MLPIQLFTRLPPIKNITTDSLRSLLPESELNLFPAPRVPGRCRPCRSPHDALDVYHRNGHLKIKTHGQSHQFDSINANFIFIKITTQQFQRNFKKQDTPHSTLVNLAPERGTQVGLLAVS